jgi:hypothetical protein
MEEMPNPTSQEATRSVLGPEMWFETLRLVIAPRIARVVREHPDIENRQQLHRTFCELHSVKMSYSTFSGWCEDLGITFRKRIEVSIPGWKEMPRPSPDFIGPMPATRQAPTPVILQDQATETPEEPIQWDQPRVQEIDPSMLNDGMPDILPGGMRAPAFFGNDYAN